MKLELMKMKVGFIGTGSIGSILIESFIESNRILPENILITNRTKKKALAIKERFENITVIDTNQEVAKEADLLFLAIKPLEYKNVIEDIKGILTKNQIIISLASPVEIELLENLLPVKIVKIIPSITNAIQKGNSLIIFGTRLTKEDKDLILNIMENISKPILITEKYLRISSDIVSCGPAFLGFFFEQMVKSSVQFAGISEEISEQLVVEMLISVSKLLENNIFTLHTLIERVAVPGGVTREGLNVMEKEIATLFPKIYQKTEEKFQADIKEVRNMMLEK